MSDLRRSATEAKRDHDHKAKWARGARQHGRSRQDQAPWDGLSGVSPATPMRLRPALPPSSATQSLLKRYNESSLKSARHAVHTRFQHDVKEALSSDSSSDETVHEAFTANGSSGTDDIPSAYVIGNTILSSAISTAELKYENKVTEKLAKEYEFVSKEDEHGVGYAADVDDFELVEHDMA